MNPYDEDNDFLPFTGFEDEDTEDMQEDISMRRGRQIPNLSEEDE